MPIEYLSQERHDSIVAELENLINVEFPRIKDELSEARAQGDLSENFEYHAAKRAQGKIIRRIRFLQNILTYSRVIDSEQLPKDKVTLLSSVTFTNLGTGETMTYTIVSPHEMNLSEGKISLNSPIGKALMGKRPGDIVDVQVPAGTMKLRIDSIWGKHLFF